MEIRYTALRTIATIYKVLGIITMALTITAAIGVFAFSLISGGALESIAEEYGGNSGGSGVISGAIIGIIGSIFTILAGGLLAITIYAIGEGISLIISLEENTRKTAYLVEQLTPIQESIVCPKCGFEQENSNKYCRRCGNNLGNGLQT
jgi:hypothetical protein